VVIRDFGVSVEPGGILKEKIIRADLQPSGGTGILELPGGP
jgi:hypothetical protein